jgi:simple sugar transport system ATP-binding protein
MIPLLKLSGINKSFGPIDVLHDISLEVKAGEVLCLLGDNGAGKSTLIKVLSGVHKPTSGTMEVNGRAVTFEGPREASAEGIATVHQFGGTFPLMSIGRSFFVGAEPTRRVTAGRSVHHLRPQICQRGCGPLDARARHHPHRRR